MARKEMEFWQTQSSQDGETMAADSSFSDQILLNRIQSLAINDDRTEETRIQSPPLRTLVGHSDYVNQILFLSEGRLASCSDDRTIRIWNMSDGQVLYALEGHSGFVFSIVQLWNGWLASGSADKTIAIWDLDARTKLRTLKGHASSVASLKVLKNGNLVSYSTDDTIRIWNPYTSQKNLLLTIYGHGNHARIIPLGVLSTDHLVACSSGNDSGGSSLLRVWNLVDGLLVKSVSTGSRFPLTLLVISNDQVALGFDHGTIKIVDLTDDLVMSLIDETDDGAAIFSMIQLSNGNLVSCSGNQGRAEPTIKVWGSKDGGINQTLAIKTDHTDAVFSLALSPAEQVSIAQSSCGELVNEFELWFKRFLLNQIKSLI